MANLKDIRTRISSVKSTMQITNAMKMVSAAKLKKAQEAIENMRPYAEKLEEILRSLAREGDEGDNVYGREREVKKVLIVAVTSNRGLCGALNSNVIKRVNELADELKKGADVHVLTIGKRGYDILKKSQHVVDNRSDLVEKRIEYGPTAELAQRIMDDFASGEYDKVILVYNRFVNPAVQKVTTEQFLPVESREEDTAATAVQTDYIFEPSREVILKELVPKSLKMKFYRTLREAWASEHGARMTAMHKATDNAKEMVADLTLQYNKARQAVITGEILEIVSGAEALKKQK
ncbi:MAG: ATP synthase F1 subunit gamma [Chlorobi bacterium]|nr:ATP synthase F1 subunit gamma [Chlorobiota bacterium]